MFALVLGLVSGLPVIADEANLDTILDNYYQAIGGEKAWMAVGSMKQTGKMQMMGMEAPFTSYAKRPGKVRIEFVMQGMTGVQAYDGETGWMLMPFMGSTDPEPMPQEMLDMMATDIDLEGPLMNWKEKGHQVELLGTEEFEGTESYRLKLTMESGNVVDMFLDSEHFVPIGMKATNTMQGMEMEVVTSISDYKEVGGLMIAHSVAAKTQMGDQVITIDTVELGAEIEDSFFTMPEKAAADAQ